MQEIMVKAKEDSGEDVTFSDLVREACYKVWYKEEA
jgi:hypothetical protein